MTDHPTIHPTASNRNNEADLQTTAADYHYPHPPLNPSLNLILPGINWMVERFAELSKMPIKKW